MDNKMRYSFINQLILLSIFILLICFSCHLKLFKKNTGVMTQPVNPVV